MGGELYINIYIYIYIYIQEALLHHFTKGKDLIRPGVTKFPTCYLTLKCLYGNKGALEKMFTSKQWKSSCFAGTTGGKLVQGVVMDDKFWKSIVVCLIGASPLNKLLHLVSLDKKPVIDFLYEEVKRVKEKI